MAEDNDTVLDVESLGWLGRNCLLYHYIKPIPLATLAVLAIVLGFYSWIYIGGLWDVTSAAAIASLRVAVLNQDQGFLATTVVPTLPPPLNQTLCFGAIFEDSLRTAPLNTTLSWYVFDENTTYDEAIQFLLTGEAWGLIYFPENYTRDVFAAFFMPPGIYSNPAQALAQLQSFPQRMVNITIFVDEGRNYATNSIVANACTRVLRGFSNTLLTTLLSTYSVLTQSLIGIVNPNFFVLGLSTNVVKFHIVEHFGQNFASYVIMVLTYIGSMMVVSVFHQPRQKIYEITESWYRESDDTKELDAKNKLHFSAFHAALSRTIGGWMYIAIGTLAITLTVQILNGQFYHNYITAWLWTFYVAISFLAINGVFALLVGPASFQVPGTLFLILQLISGSSVYSSDQQNRFFKVGYGLPFTYGVRGLRAIYFGALDDGYSWMVNGLVVMAWIIPMGTVYLFLRLKATHIYGAAAVMAPLQGNAGTFPAVA